MPRANRYMLPGYTYHLTHRCHNRSFLFRFVRRILWTCDRTEYRRRLRAALGEFKVSLLTYCITSNHTHLLAKADEPETISGFMQKLEGEFAEYYNIRKRRSGAFWEGRYGCTMIDDGTYLWACMKYIDLNMVRVGTVGHPSEWDWCGYRELVGERQRYCLLDMPEILRQYENCSLDDFRSNYKQVINEAIERQELAREALWTESIAVGSESFVKAIEENTSSRIELTIEETLPSRWTLREAGASYS